MLVEFPEPWRAVGRDEACNAEAELRREVCVQHVLARVSAECLARRDDQDEFLFRLHDHASEFAIVHLTWRIEPRPDWPHTTLCAGTKELMAELRGGSE